MYPDARRDLDRFIGLTTDQVPFRFLRFSDGEMEIIRNEPLEISPTHLNWREGSVRHNLPAYDVKKFDPIADANFRRDLLAAASHRGENFYKGVPTAHNRAISDRDLMVELNGGTDANLTFSDLLTNSNYGLFLRKFLPILLDRADVFVIGNFRMQPDLAHQAWKLIPVPDNFFSRYVEVKEEVLISTSRLPTGAIVLSSASSLSNIVGHEVDQQRSDLTFIDIGTAMHGFLGLDPKTRDYHMEGLPWNARNFIPKVRYRLAPHYRIRW